ncbi:unnamed protein product [Clonostachys chloroleuca]|uniref:RGS domain-containing protein n=1 Tax=Clonostachys chloroleuca TaxID=1926264 RepID=A0AA35Q8C7_9HYPO|nr:unnamed protein product [Clonostachys chloroleuca]
MATSDNVTIYNLPPSPPKWDKVGIFFVSFCGTWSTLVFAGMIICWTDRRDPVLKVRGLPLSFSAILLLHTYWILAQLMYPVGRTLPILVTYDIQYFFMCIWLPLGIALLHTSNSRLVCIAKLQKQFTSQPLVRLKCNGGDSSVLCWFRNLECTAKLMVLLSAGMILQVVLAIGMWMACRKYHPAYGIPGTGIHGDNLSEQIIDLGRGWELWPSVLWQVLWAWVVAPILTWRAWGIHDTMGWRTQIIGCCISNLHATPLFLIAQYVPAFESVNDYFHPIQWINLSIMMLEVFTVFIPVFQVIKLQIQYRKAAASHARWETSFQATAMGLSHLFSQVRKESAMSMEAGPMMDHLLSEDMSDQVGTMGALEFVLRANPSPLQDFAALNDFSGENIAFLSRVAGWKSAYADATQGPRELEAYNAALQIYTDFISPHQAEFPLNLSATQLKCLEGIFAEPARSLCGEPTVHSATRFDIEQPPSPSSLPRSSLEEGSGAQEARARYMGEIPRGFSNSVFDTTHSNIRYQVLTNTWPRFIEEMKERRRVSGQTDYAESSASSRSLIGRIPSLFRATSRG